MLARAVFLALGLGSIAVSAGCTKSAPVDTKPRVVVSEPLFEGTGAWTRAGASSNADAQTYFDQGMRFLFGFNHDEAIRSFAQASAFDASCAWCAIGAAIANGPHINNPDLDDAHLNAARTALANLKPTNEIERGLVDALHARYDGTDRAHANEAYANAMLALWKKTGDADVGALAAEALFDLRPWDQWTGDGKMEPRTDEIVDVLAQVLAKSPQHPLANHLAVHLWEQSPTPEKADDAATRLRTMAPALAHLVHMPTHIDVRRGRWADAIAASDAALQADARYLDDADKRGVAIGFYRFYVAHNEHMLAYAAMMSGRKEKALAAVHRMMGDIPSAWLQQNASVADGIEGLPLEVMMRFGEWKQIESAPEFDASLPISRALRLAARAVAFAAEGDVAQAKKEQAAFVDAKSAVPSGAHFGNNKAQAVLDVAAHVVDGEVAVADKRVNEGIESLRAAVTAEDALRYDEPPDWMVPARHALGAVLLNAGKLDEARAVYDEDLRRVPENGWALLGLSQVLDAKHDAKSAAEFRARFDAVFKDADVKPSTSCMCQQRKK